MKRLLAAMTASLMVLALAGSALASSPSTSGNKLQCFSGTTDGGYGGTCTLIKNGATLNTTDGNTNGSYAGVYIENTNLGGKLLAAVNKLSFTFTGGPVVGGSPRMSIGIDENGDGTTEAYAFVDAALCGLTTGGTVGLNCPVAYGSTVYANWAAFAAANPTFKLSTDTVPFVIADQPFSGTVTNVQLGRGPAKS